MVGQSSSVPRSRVVSLQRTLVTSSIAVPRLTLDIQGVALTGRNTTGPASHALRAVPCELRCICATVECYRRRQTTDDDDRRQLAKQYWPSTLCVGGSVIKECTVDGWECTSDKHRRTVTNRVDDNLAVVCRLIWAYLVSLTNSTDSRIISTTTFWCFVNECVFFSVRPV